MKITKEEKIRLLEKWQETYERSSEIFQKLDVIFGFIASGSLFDIVWENFNAYTEALSVILGDEEEWLEWYAFENKFGKKEYRAGCNDKMRKIKNFEDLLWVIETKCKCK